VLLPQRYYRELLRHFTRSFGDRDTAADVVQEAYVRIFALQSKGNAILDPRALLYHVGRNVAATQATRRAAEQRMLDTLGLVAADAAPSVERTVIARQQLDALVRRLSVMPRKRRDAFILVRIHGCSYAEAGAYMGLRVEAIERHVMRGILDCAGLAPSRR
jgi:RNA polymerase sigma-70 factor (ECF subfamily)